MYLLATDIVDRYNGKRHYYADNAQLEKPPKGLELWYALRDLGGPREWVAWVDKAIVRLESCGLAVELPKPHAPDTRQIIYTENYKLDDATLTGTEQDNVCDLLRRGDSLPVACQKAGVPIGYYRKTYLEPDGIHTNWQSEEPTLRNPRILKEYESTAPGPRQLLEKEIESYGKCSLVSSRFSKEDQYKKPERLSTVTITNRHGTIKVPIAQYDHFADIGDRRVDLFKVRHCVWKPTDSEKRRLWTSAYPMLSDKKARNSIRFIAAKLYRGNEYRLNNEPVIFATSDGRCGDLESHIFEHIWRYDTPKFNEWFPQFMAKVKTKKRQVENALTVNVQTDVYQQRLRHGYKTPARMRPDEK